MTASTDHASSEPVANATRDSASEHSPLTGPALIIVSILLGLANTVAVLDITIANVSLPHIAGSFGVNSHEATWVITGYAIAEAITGPTDRLARPPLRHR
jgi:DHA2 family multidrug resistance protein